MITVIFYNRDTDTYYGYNSQTGESEIMDTKYTESLLNLNQLSWTRLKGTDITVRNNMKNKSAGEIEFINNHKNK